MKYHSEVKYVTLYHYIAHLVNCLTVSNYKHNRTTYEGSKIDTITSQFGLQQLITEPTDILTDSSPCIDLLFTSQPNLVMESGVHSSLHQNCHHQIIYPKINLKVFFPPLYEREVWHYQRANE